MRKRDKIKAAAYEASLPLRRLSSSIDSRRILSIRSKMVTPNYTHEGRGREQRIAREAIIVDGQIVAQDVYRISSRTTIHGKGPTGFYRGTYR